MTPVSCPDVAELDRLLELPLEDPRRSHLERCPRCRARLSALRAFENPASIPPAADLAAARAQVSRVVHAQRPERGGGSKFPLPETEETGRSPGALPGRPGFPWIGSRRGWLVAVPLAAAAVFLIVLLDRGPDVPEAPTLRSVPPAEGESGAGTGSVDDPRLDTPARVEGGVELRWSGLESADGYLVEIFSPTLEPIYLVGPIPHTRWVLADEDVPAALTAGARFLWRVRALRGSDEIAVSESRTATWPAH